VILPSRASDRDSSERKPPHQRVLGATGPEHARIEVERIDPNGWRGKLTVPMQPLPNRGRGIARTAGNRNVRLKSPHVEIYARGDERVVEPLSELKKARMPRPRPHPKHPRRPLRRECAHRLDRQEKRFDLQGSEALAHSRNPFCFDIAKEANGHVELVRANPGDSVKRLRQRCHQSAHGFGQAKGDKKALLVDSFHDRAESRARATGFNAGRGAYGQALSVYLISR
jgi:hypothetical protein